MSDSISTNAASPKKASYLNAQMMTKIALLGTLAFLAMMFEFALPIFVPFYQLGFDEVIVMIGGFALGPFAAVCIEAIKILLNLIVRSTVTAGIGEFANFLIGCAYVVPAAYFYQKHKDKHHAIIALIIGTISLTIMGTIINYFIVLPLYSAMLPLPMDQLIGMGNAINPNINSLFLFVLFMCAPFNLLKGVISSVIVLCSYKRVSTLLKR